MEPRAALFFVFATTILADASARAVNISNTWVLPEEGFPVFYRYFRDRISWYEADAVCQFHHANLVTVDSTSQFDAIRAYLKELDITNGVWIGLQKTSDKPNFTWTDFRPLSSDNHWQEAIPVGSDPLCVAMDPAADFRWHALSCGGPAIASFICELPVPSWATGTGGCLLTELPSLTVLYIPEQSALELTSDCGLDGTKRIACKGNANHDEMIKQLACTINHDDFEEKSTKNPSVTTTTTPDTTYSSSTSHQTTIGTKTTKPWIWTNTVDTDEYSSPTRHRRETENTMGPLSTQSTGDIRTPTTQFQKERLEDVERTTKSSGRTTDANSKTTLMSEKKTITHLKQEDKRQSSPVAHESTVIDTSGTTPDGQTDMTATVETKTSETADSEYPSAISQGQLFSIIENGTLFDIIEMNETGTEDSKLKNTTAVPKPHVEIQLSKSETTPGTITKNTEILYTTVMYNKEPTEETFPVTNESLKKGEQQKIMFKDLHSQKTANHLSKKEDDKTLSKEVEMLPSGTAVNSMMKLNRTNRKDLPMIEDFDDNNDEIDLDIDNKLPFDKPFTRHQTVEIKLHSDQNKTKSVIFVTTKVTEKNKKVKETKNAGTQTGDIKLTSTTDPSVTDHSITVKSTTTNDPSLPSKFLKEEFLPRSLQQETQIISSKKPEAEVRDPEVENFEGTDEPLYSEPQAQPRPNRQRQLTRPQRKSFYPYFFSRMLG